MRTSLLALLLLGMIIAVAGCTGSTDVNVTVNTSGGSGALHDVALTDAGFVPATITISAGDTVRWTNQAARSVWPASDVHPTHQNVPGFDPLRGLSQGETYSFTFTKAETVTYHDHLTPSVVGTIIVEPR